MYVDPASLQQLLEILHKSSVCVRVTFELIGYVKLWYASKKMPTFGTLF